MTQKTPLRAYLGPRAHPSGPGLPGPTSLPPSFSVFPPWSLLDYHPSSGFCWAILAPRRTVAPLWGPSCPRWPSQVRLKHVIHIALLQTASSVPSVFYSRPRSLTEQKTKKSPQRPSSPMSLGSSSCRTLDRFWTRRKRGKSPSTRLRRISHTLHCFGEGFVSQGTMKFHRCLLMGRTTNIHQVLTMHQAHCHHPLF